MTGLRAEWNDKLIKTFKKTKSRIRLRLLLNQPAELDFFPKFIPSLLVPDDKRIQEFGGS